MASEWAQAESYVDDEGQHRVFRLLPYEVEIHDVPPPDYIPDIPVERTPSPLPARYAPEPCTPPQKDDKPSNETIQARFAAMDINRRMGSKKGEFPGNQQTEPRGRWAPTRRSTSPDMEASPSTWHSWHRKRPATDLGAAPLKKRRGRPRKLAATELDETPLKQGKGRPRKQAVDELEAEGVAFLVSDDDDGEESDRHFSDDNEDEPEPETDVQSEAEAVEILSDDDGLLANIRRPRRKVASVHYRDMTVQEADALKINEQRAMCGSGSGSEAIVDQAASGGIVEGEAQSEVLNLVSELDKENEPPANTRRPKRQASGPSYRDLTPRESDATQANQQQVMRGLQDDEDDASSGWVSGRRARRGVPRPRYRDMTAREADEFQVEDQRVSEQGSQASEALIPNIYQASVPPDNCHKTRVNLSSTQFCK